MEKFLDQTLIVDGELKLTTFLLAEQVDAEYSVVKFLHFAEMLATSLFGLFMIFIKLNLSVDTKLFPEQGH